MDLGLAGKVVIVTGATANIGRAIALDFATDGAKVVIVGRDAEAGARVVAEAKARGAAGAVFVAADMLDPASPAKILAAAEALGPVAVLVNNVGGNVGTGFFAASDPATWEGDIDLNFKTNLRMTRALLPGMIERQAGRIVNIGSTAGIVGDYQLPVYSAMKAAVHGFTVVLAKEIAQHGITVNAVAPYATFATDPAAFSTGSRFHTDSDFIARSSAGATDYDKKMRRRLVPGPREFAQPEEISAAVLYLASDRAQFVTGQILSVDGGALL
jgi:NAD(P)-dependent dehydrogenase (short-subunit alcohol dehydrogenase family)